MELHAVNLVFPALENVLTILLTSLVTGELAQLSPGRVKGLNGHKQHFLHGCDFPLGLGIYEGVARPVLTALDTF